MTDFGRFCNVNSLTCFLLCNRSVTAAERGLSSPQQLPNVRTPGFADVFRADQLAADWKVDWKVRAPPSAPAVTDRLFKSLHEARLRLHEFSPCAAI